MTRRPRLLVLQSWISFRGAEHISVEIAHLCSVRHGWDVRLLAGYVDWERLPPFGNQIHYLLPHPLLQRLFRRSRLAYLLLAPVVLTVMAIRAAGWADVLNPHNPPCETAAAIAGMLRRRPVVWVTHGLPPRLPRSQAKDLTEWLTWRLARPCYRWSARQASSIITASRKIARELDALTGRASTPIYQAVDYSLFSHGDRREGRRLLGIAARTPVLLIAGQLHRGKQQHRVLELLHHLLKLWPDLVLVLAGTGPAEEELRALAARLSVESHVIFTGYLERSRLAHVYAACDLSLVPYWKDEGCPAVPFEALVAGAPSLVAFGCGADELISKWDAGYIWHPGEPLAPAIANTLEKVLRRRPRTMIERGREQIKAELSWRRYVEQAERLFRAQLSSPRHTP